MVERRQHTGDREPILPRHVQVEYHDIGTEAGHLARDVRGGIAIPDDPDVGDGMREHAEPGAKQRVIINQEHPDGLR